MLSVTGSIAGNVLQLGEVADLEAQMFNLALKPHLRQTAVMRSGVESCLINFFHFNTIVGTSKSVYVSVSYYVFL